MDKKKILLASTLALTVLFAQKPILPDILDPKQTTSTPLVHSTFERTGPTVQIGILLDTSGSMNGLISQAKDQLWKIVNEVSKANKNDKDVTIQVGLFEYGKSSIPKYEGYLQMLSHLTTDLDKVSDELFKLRTNGGNEYAGKVILSSVNRFAWSTHEDDLKILIVAGNESFAQGDVPYKAAINKAKENGIIVNTVFCGDDRDGARLHWVDAAKIGEGKYFNINHNNKREYIATPYDGQIIILGERLNATYVTYGESGIRKAKRANISKQDSNSKSLAGASYVERSLVKASKQYAQSESDMVSVYMEDKEKVSSISQEELPDELKGKDSKEVKAIMEKKKADRLSIQNEIKGLESKRTDYIAKQNKVGEGNLGSAIVKSIKEQAVQNGYKFSK